MLYTFVLYEGRHSMTHFFFLTCVYMFTGRLNSTRKLTQRCKTRTVMTSCLTSKVARKVARLAARTVTTQSKTAARRSLAKLCKSLA